MDKKLFIFFGLFWVCGRLDYLAVSYPLALCLHGVGLHILIISFLLYVIYKIPYEKIKEKLFFCWVLVYELFGFITYTFVKLTANHTAKWVMWEQVRHSGMFYISPYLAFIEHIFIPLFVVFVAYEIYRRMSKFDKEKSATLNDENIFLAVSYPKDFIGLLLCLFSRYKGNSVCLYANGFLYTYTKESGSIVKIQKDEIDIDKFFFINTDIFYEERREDLESLVGKKWAINSNCIYNTYEPIVGTLHNYI